MQHKMSICWPSTKIGSSLVNSCYRFTTAGQCSFVAKSILLMMQLKHSLVRGLYRISAGQFTSKLRVYCKASQLWRKGSTLMWKQQKYCRVIFTFDACVVFANVMLLEWGDEQIHHFRKQLCPASHKVIIIKKINKCTCSLLHSFV